MENINIKILFSPDEDIDGFSLADFSLSAKGVTFTTENNPKLKLMIFLTLTDLMDGMVEIIKNKKRKSYSLLSISSSFNLHFEKLKDFIIIKDKNRELKIKFMNFLEALDASLEELIKVVDDLHLESDSGIKDFKDAFASFSEALNLMR